MKKQKKNEQMNVLKVLTVGTYPDRVTRKNTNNDSLFQRRTFVHFHSFVRGKTRKKEKPKQQKWKNERWEKEERKRNSLLEF